jgi:hypothetical protein
VAAAKMPQEQRQTQLTQKATAAMARHHQSQELL